MTALAVRSTDANADLARWGGAALVAAALHALIAVAWMYQADEPVVPGTEIPAILVDLAPSSAAPQVQPLDLAPGPPMQQAEEAAPAPAEDAANSVTATLPPTSPQPDAPVTLPAGQPVSLTPSPPDAKPVTEKLKKPKPDHTRKKPKHDRPIEQHAAPRTTAAPRSERQADAMASARSGFDARQAALPSYRDRLAAHLQRFKQYPADAKAMGIQGVATVTFTVGRAGQLLVSRLARSSGNAALDAETLAMLRRAQPLPAFPPEIAQSAMTFTLPMQFSLR